MSFSGNGPSRPEVDPLWSFESRLFRDRIEATKDHEINHERQKSANGNRKRLERPLGMRQIVKRRLKIEKKTRSRMKSIFFPVLSGNYNGVRSLQFRKSVICNAPISSQWAQQQHSARPDSVRHRRSDGDAASARAPAGNR